MFYVENNTIIIIIILLTGSVGTQRTVKNTGGKLDIYMFLEIDYLIWKDVGYIILLNDSS